MIDLARRVEKPARYIGGEFGALVKRDARLRVALLFPDVYEVGESYLGLKILYKVLNDIEGVAAEAAQLAGQLLTKESVSGRTGKTDMAQPHFSDFSQRMPY